MPTYQVNGFGELKKLFRKHMTVKRKHLRKALKTSIGKGEKIVASNIPIAFGELKHGLSSSVLLGPEDSSSSANTKAKIEVSAPHSVAVEVGSRPHMPPLEPILKWVKLRGMQGVNRSGKGPTTRKWAKYVRIQISSYEVRSGKGSDVGRHTPVDAPEKVARSIQHAISVSGTKPQWYMRRSLPEFFTILQSEIRSAMMQSPGD